MGIIEGVTTIGRGRFIRLVGIGVDQICKHSKIRGPARNFDGPRVRTRMSRVCDFRLEEVVKERGNAIGHLV